MRPKTLAAVLLLLAFSPLFSEKYGFGDWELEGNLTEAQAQAVFSSLAFSPNPNATVWEISAPSNESLIFMSGGAFSPTAEVCQNASPACGNSAAIFAKQGSSFIKLAILNENRGGNLALPQTELGGNAPAKPEKNPSASTTQATPSPGFLSGLLPWAWAISLLLVAALTAAYVANRPS